MSASEDELREIFRAYTKQIKVAWGIVQKGMHSTHIIQMSAKEQRLHRRRCNHCRSVPGYPKPLRANGTEYQRRVRSRKRRANR